MCAWDVSDPSDDSDSNVQPLVALVEDRMPGFSVSFYSKALIEDLVFYAGHRDAEKIIERLTAKLGCDDDEELENRLSLAVERSREVKSTSIPSLGKQDDTMALCESVLKSFEQSVGFEIVTGDDELTDDEAEEELESDIDAAIESSPDSLALNTTPPTEVRSARSPPPTAEPRQINRKGRSKLTLPPEPTRVRNNFSIEISQPDMPWNDQKYNDGTYPSFLKRYEVARHFVPYGPFTPDAELMRRLHITDERNVTQVIQDYYGISLPLATSKVWRFLDFPEEEPWRKVVFKISVRASKGSWEDSVKDLVVSLKPPGIDNTCRMREKFGSDRFIRVEFDEDLVEQGDLPNKITFCDRVYEFLCPRDSYCYFFATKSLIGEFPDGLTPYDVIDWHISLDGNADMTVNKLASRIRLAFSSIYAICTWPTENYRAIPDTMVGDILMSDGCAPIGLNRMIEIRNSLGLQSDELPSAVQARCGGSKGLWYLDLTLDPDEICIRESQIKFHREDWTKFEVIGYSKPSGPARLNRQLIFVLGTLGVPSSVFIELQAEMVKRFSELIFADDPFVTAGYIDGLMRKAEDPDEANALFSDILTMILSGFDQSNWYLKTLQAQVYGRMVGGLKERAKLEVHKSRTVFIIADYTGLLEPGQCFIQIEGTDDDGELLGILQDEVAIARSPAHLPSDFRRFKCVDLEAFHHLHEILVLPAKGDVCPASLLSCGDYDGDRVFLTWEPRLVESITNRDLVEPPPDFENNFSYHTEKVGALLAKPDGKQLFLDYMFNLFMNTKSMLRIFSHWHMKLCDEHGAEEPICVELAHVCRRLVDAEKSGLRPTQLYLEAMGGVGESQPLPHWYFRSEEARATRNCRPSTSAVGALYDSVDDATALVDAAQQRFNKNFDKDLIRYYDKIPPMIRSTIESEMNQLFKEYNAELTMRLADDKKSSVDELAIRFRKEAFLGVTDLGEAKIRAVVMYKVTHTKSQKIDQPMSFCWKVAGDLLMALKASSVDFRHFKTTDPGIVLHPFVLPRRRLNRITVDRKALIRS